MTNPYYNPSGAPGTRAKLSSSPIRAELAAVGTGFDKLAPTLTANALLHVNAAGTQQVANANITVSAAGALAGITDLTTTGNGHDGSLCVVGGAGCSPAPGHQAVSAEQAVSTTAMCNSFKRTAVM